jgi:uncharacterized membrane protein YtjA (UPF0391 family)
VRKFGKSSTAHQRPAGVKRAHEISTESGTGRRNRGALAPLHVHRAACDAGGNAMSLLKWALIFLVISLVAALFGFTGISEATADIARVLFYIFVVIFLVLLILGLTIFRNVSG